MKSAFLFGFKPDEFWKMTPSELFVISEAYEDSQSEKIKMIVISAWYGAMFERQKTLPSLDNVIKNFGNKEYKEDTDEEILQKIVLLNAALGGEVIDSRKRDS